MLLHQRGFRGGLLLTHTLVNKNRRGALKCYGHFPFFIHYFTTSYFCGQKPGMRKLSMEELGRKTPEEFRKSEKLPLVVVLENVRSAYNVGSVFRTADAFLLEAIYLCGYTAFPPHKEIRKTALGAEETVNW